jgi:hypothetical protein
MLSAAVGHHTQQETCKSEDQTLGNACMGTTQWTPQVMLLGTHCSGCFLDSTARCARVDIPSGLSLD